MGLGNGFVLRLDGGESFTYCLQLGFDILARVFGCVQFALEGVQFLDAGRRGARLPCGDEGLVEGFPVKVLRPFPQIGAARPVKDVRQLPHDVQRLLRHGCLVAVHRRVARLPDELRLLPHDLGHERTERGVAEVGVQVRDLRRAQGLLDPVDTLDQTLQRVPGMEARGPRVAVDVVLRIARTLRRVRELLLQEREVGRDFHGGSEIAPEGTGLQGGEEGVEFGQMGELTGPLFLDGFGDICVSLLDIQWRNRYRKAPNDSHV